MCAAVIKDAAFSLFPKAATQKSSKPTTNTININLTEETKEMTEPSKNEQDLTVRCEDCGHLLPKNNLAIHRATCHDRVRHPTREDHERTVVGHDESRESTDKSAPTNSVDMARCEACGKNIPSISVVAHSARCQRETVTRVDQVEGQEKEAIEAVDEIISGAIVSSDTNATGAQPSSPAPNQSTNTQQQPQEWSCPRCTLRNPNTSNTCQACSHIHHISPGTHQFQNPNGRNLNFEVREGNPHVASAVSSAVSVSSWSLLGALVGGPVGAIVLGGTAAVLDGVSRIHRHQAEQRGDPPPRPRFTFTTTSVSTTPWGGSTMRVSSNASGQRRNVTIRSRESNFSQMTPADRRILSMLLLNASSQGAAHPDQMSYEELLQRFGVGTENRRGASQETIDRLPLTKLDQKTIDQLEGNQSMCNICLEEFKENDEMRKLGCSHAFHKECIDRWVSQVSSCPICKKQVE